MGTTTPTLRWTGDSIEIIDQTRLPAELVLIDVRDVATAVDAIGRLAIRGAPALGAFGALALVVGLDEAQPASMSDARALLEQLRTEIGDARPTAVNLRWAVDRTIDAALHDAGHISTGGGADGDSIAALRQRLLDEALAIGAEDVQACAGDRTVGPRTACRLHRHRDTLQCRAAGHRRHGHSIGRHVREGRGG